LLFACSRRKTIVGSEAAGVGLEDNGVNKEQVAVIIGIAEVVQFDLHFSSFHFVSMRKDRHFWADLQTFIAFFRL